MLTTFFIVLLALNAVNAAPQVDLNDEAVEQIIESLLKNRTDFATSVKNNHEESEHLAKRVINGEDAPPYAFPWAVSIKGVYPKSKATTYCGASFINNQWLITAAHCFIGKTANGDTMRNPKYWHVQAGNVFIELGSGHSKNQKIFGPNGLHSPTLEQTSSSGIVGLLRALLTGQPLVSKLNRNIAKKYGPIFHSHLKEIVVHPKYRSNNLEWDIALLKLKYPIHLDRYDAMSPINLPPKFEIAQWPKPGELCVLVGWGCTKAHGGPSMHAQLARLKVVKNEQCSNMYQHNAGLNSRHEFCAGYYKGNIGICPGDSGSGLACNRYGKWYVVGVASATHAKKPASYPGLFTRVSYFRDWIDSVTNGENYNI